MDYTFRKPPTSQQMFVHVARKQHEFGVVVTDGFVLPYSTFFTGDACVHVKTLVLFVAGGQIGRRKGGRTVTCGRPRAPPTEL